MQRSVEDEITVRIVYEGRAAKVILDEAKLKEIEEYYKSAPKKARMIIKSTRVKPLLKWKSFWR
ncbi:MAG: hypothetical protein U0V48_16705 [Anaerolineales bacterium]